MAETMSRRAPESPNLVRADAAAQGVHREGIDRFIGALSAAEGEPHSFMLVRHGVVVAEAWWEPYGLTQPHQLYSVSKSVTAIAWGFALQEGLVSLDDRVVDVLEDERPTQVSANLAAMTARHLLTMTSGHHDDTMPLLRRPGEDWVRSILGEPVPEEPGKHFVYNSGASYLLAAMLERATGTRLIDFLQPRLWEPLGITQVTWEECPRGIAVGGWGLSLSTEALAAFGQFCLRRGAIHGEQLLDPSWLDAASRGQVITADQRPDWALGYGFHFRPARHGSYRAAGAFGQLCLMIPGKDAVVVLTAAISNPQLQLDLIWRHLLPAMEGTGSRDSPAANAPRPAGQQFARNSPQRPHAGRPGLAVDDRVEFAFASNALGITRSVVMGRSEGIDVTLDVTGGAGFIVPFVEDDWRRASVSFPFDGPIEVLATGFWESDGRFVGRIVRADGPAAYEIEIDFSTPAPQMRIVKNDSLWEDELAPVVGTATATTAQSSRSAGGLNVNEGKN